MAKKTNKQVKKAVKEISKSKYFGLFLIIIFIMVAAFFIYCCVNPELYNKIMALFNKSEPLREKDNVITYYTDAYVVNNESELDDLKVHMVDVGQGDAIIIELPDGSNVLIDGGENSEKKKLLTYIDGLDIDVFDVVILTHSDADHIGGIDEVFDNYVVKNCYRPYVYYSGNAFELDPEFNEGADSIDHDSAAYGRVLDKIYNETYTDSEGQSYYCNWEYFNNDSSFGRDIIVGDKTYNYNFDFLTPTKNFDDISYTNRNDFSPYVLFTYGEKGATEGDTRFDLMLTGDAEAAALKELLDFYSTENLDVDVLKVGHHGSKTSTTPDLLNKITPEYAIISCGEGNSYKHPHQNVLDYLLDANVQVRRTDMHGSIILTVSEFGSYNCTYTATNVNDGKIFVGGDA